MAEVSQPGRGLLNLTYAMPLRSFPDFLWLYSLNRAQHVQYKHDSVLNSKPADSGSYRAGAGDI